MVLALANTAQDELSSACSHPVPAEGPGGAWVRCDSGKMGPVESVGTRQWRQRDVQVGYWLKNVARAVPGGLYLLTSTGELTE